MVELGLGPRVGFHSSEYEFARHRRIKPHRMVRFALPSSNSRNQPVSINLTQSAHANGLGSLKWCRSIERAYA
jgi:hypothetical protein